jgi:HAD superfamily hydrolase (TIGR01549 family)
VTQRWFCFDVGETLIDETRVWCCWARALGLSPLTLFGVMGGLIGRGESHEQAFDVLERPAWRDHAPDVEARYGGFRSEDLYGDAVPALAALRAAGYRIAVAGNQPAARHDQLVALGVDAEVVAMSGAIGVEKPDPAFFARVLEMTGSPDPGHVAYVGDRPDNDVVPALRAGMRAVWVRRGPWAFLHSDGGRAALVVRSLAELAAAPERVWAGSG